MNTSHSKKKAKVIAQRIDALVCAALDMQECEGLTPDQQDKAGRVYELASSLESDLNIPADIKQQIASES